MKRIALLILYVLSLNVTAQTISSRKWTDLFSYNNVLALREDQGKLIAATENGIFYYTPATGEVTKLSKANGLHEVKISAFDYNPETKIGLVGYKNGSLDVITPEGITYVVDIPVATGFAGNKNINHISISGNLAVISVGYGVSIFRLDKKEFADSVFFIDGGVFQPVKEAVIKDNMIFALTPTSIKSHKIDVTFGIYSTWTEAVPGSYTQLAQGGVLAYANNDMVYYGDGSSFTPLSQNFAGIQDVVVTDKNLIVTSSPSVYVFDLAGNPVKSFDATQVLNTGIFSNSNIYAGSKLDGMINERGDKIKPDGPYNNTSYKINIVKNQMVISSGGRTDYNRPNYNNLGYYHFNGSQWIYPDFFKNFSDSYNIMDAVINPAKPSEIFFVNFSFRDGEKGIYRMENNEFKNKYATTGNAYYRVSGLTFDENNQLFVSASENGKLGFYYYSPATDSFTTVMVLIGGDSQKLFAKDGILYIPSPYFNDGGLIMYDYKNTPSNLQDDRFKILRRGNNLPASGVVSAALDKNDDLWIGTRIGLRILSNPSAAIDEVNPQAEPIIIEENGVGEELFRDGHILQIEVDGGNQKWVSVDDGGVFYLSANGEQTLQRFNRFNSPLPTDNVTDIKIDPATGKVYFVTLDGVVVYQGDVLTVTKNFGDVLVYPNPVVQSQYKGNVRIRGLAAKTNIRITDAAGNLVHQALARGGSYEWNLLNHRGTRVASGIYFVLMTNEDGSDKATAKIAVVN